jgi:DNA-binding transcriptional regulator YiaG
MGLPSVEVDVTIRTCTNGHREVAHKAILRTLDAVANALANKNTQLTGPEIRFLRKQLGLSGQDFAKFMMVTPEWVSKWENEKVIMSSVNEQRLRSAVQHGMQIFDYDIKHAKKPKPLRMRVSQSHTVVLLAS